MIEEFLKDVNIFSHLSDEKIDEIKAHKKTNLKTGACSFLFLKKKSSINPIIIKPIGKWTNSGWNLPIKS